MERIHPDDGPLPASQTSTAENEGAPGPATPQPSARDAFGRLPDSLYHLREAIYGLRGAAARTLEHGRPLEVLACFTALLTNLVCARNGLSAARALASRLPTAPHQLDHPPRDQLRVVTCALAGEMHEIGLLFQTASARFDGTDAAVFIQLLVECVIAVGDLSLGAHADVPSAFAVTARRRV